MNRGERNRLARELTGILTRHGALSVEVIDEPKHRCTTLDATMPGVRVSIDIDDLTEPMAHWHRAERRLNPAVFGCVNPVHGTKATTLRESWPAFTAEIERLCKAVKDGSGFEQH
jgi:hypothetical protein